MIRVLPESSVLKEVIGMPVERLLVMCRFENRGKVNYLGLEIDLKTNIPTNSGSSPVST
jgi:hypothetical protein